MENWQHVACTWQYMGNAWLMWAMHGRGIAWAWAKYSAQQAQALACKILATPDTSTLCYNVLRKAQRHGTRCGICMAVCFEEKPVVAPTRQSTRLGQGQHK